MARPALVCALGLAGLLASGCAGWGYGRVHLGQPLRDARRAFPESRSRWAQSTFCYLESDYVGRTDAVVLLLTPDQQVAGKFHAQSFRRNYGVTVTAGFRLRGVVDPRLAGFGGSGPLDLLRGVADDLTQGTTDSFSREAHHWVAAGIVRLLENWPEADDTGPAPARLSAVLECVPADGTSAIWIDDAGLHRCEYKQGQTH